MKKGLITAIIAVSALTVYAVEPETFRYWIQVMEYGVSSQRLTVIEEIEAAEAQEAYYLIENAMATDENEDVQSAAVYSLIRLKQGTEDIWISAYDNSLDKDEDLVRMILYGIGELGISNAAPTILERLPDYIDDASDYYLPERAIRTLGKLGYKEAGDYILGVLTNIAYEDDLRAAAAVAIADCGTEDQILQLVDTINNSGEELYVRMYSAYALGKSGSDEAIDVLVPIVQDEDEELYLRQYAMSGLGFFDDQQVIDMMFEFSSVDNESIRAQAIETLGQLKVPDAKEILIFKARYDPSTVVVTSAISALSNYTVTNEELIRSLRIKANWSSDVDVKTAAQDTLDVWGYEWEDMDPSEYWNR